MNTSHKQSLLLCNKLLVILGPTSTGKTDLALSLAERLNGELVSADSRQVYKYLDLGTGKLPGKFLNLKKDKRFWEIDGIKVRMYDVVDPSVRFNLYQYITQAGEIINNIAASGQLPVLVGGTGLYIRSLLEGVSDFGLGEDLKLRPELEALSLDEIKKRIKPEILSKLNNSEANNKRRLIRLIEKLSSNKSNNSYPGLAKDFDILKIGLNVDRKILNSRINSRVVSRIEQGMIEESMELLKKNILSHRRMEELGLEYRYLSRLIRGDIKSTDGLIDLLSIKIRQFAKRQMTWFKKEKNVVWFDISEENFSMKVAKKVLDWYN